MGKINVLAPSERFIDWLLFWTGWEISFIVTPWQAESRHRVAAGAFCLSSVDVTERGHPPDNVFVCDGDAVLTFPRSSDYRLEKNVIVAGGTIRITRPEAISEAVGNIALSRSGKVEGVKLEAYRQAGTQPIESGDGCSAGL